MRAKLGVIIKGMFMIFLMKTRPNQRLLFTHHTQSIWLEEREKEFIKVIRLHKEKLVFSLRKGSKKETCKLSTFC